MDTAIINIRTEPLVKKKAKRVAETLGLSLSSIIDAYLRQLIRTKTVTFSAASEEPTEYLLDALEESRKDIEAGRVISFKKPADALRYFDKMIENEKRPKRTRQNWLLKEIPEAAQKSTA